MTTANIPHYELYIKVKPEDSYLRINGNITIDNPNHNDYITFILNDNVNVNYIKDCKQKPLFYKEKTQNLNDRNKVNVKLVTITVPDDLKHLDKYTIKMEYEGKFDNKDIVLGDVSEYPFDDRFCLLRSNSLCFPVIAEPNYRAITAELSKTFSYAIEIEIPRDYSVASAGRLIRISNSTHHRYFQFERTAPSKSFNIVISKYNLIKAKDLHINVFALPKHKNLVDTVFLKELKRCHKYYSETFGHHEKPRYFTLIEVRNGYGNSFADGCVLVEEQVIDEGEKYLTRLYKDLGHNWSIMASPEDGSSLFFDESFACYLEALAIKTFIGVNAFDEKMIQFREGHAKGPWALYVLNELMGDDNFYRLSRKLLTISQDSPVTFEVFRENIKELSSFNIDKFFEDWISGNESLKLLSDNVGIDEIKNMYL